MIDLTFARIEFSWAVGLGIYIKHRELHLVLGITHIRVKFGLQLF